jgi:hypothetical protein
MEAFQLGELVIDVLYFGGIYIIMRHMTFVKKHLALFQLVEINTNPLVIRVYIYIYIDQSWSESSDSEPYSMFHAVKQSHLLI